MSKPNDRARTIAQSTRCALPAAAACIAFLACSDQAGNDETVGEDSSTLLAGEISLWRDGDRPAVASVNDTKAVELGVRVRADKGGVISGIRFYKGAGNTGRHTAHLWTSAGALLKSATFVDETASGWQTVRFDAPVAIAAGATYIASYHTDVGRYAGDNGYFANRGVDNGPLHGPADSASTPNGVYRYGGVGFPSATYQSTNYWVDVVYKPDAATDGGTPADGGSMPSDGGSTNEGGSTPSDGGASTPDGAIPIPTGNCAASPHVCGYPDPTNTGVTPGTVLKKVPAQVTSGAGWEWDTRGFIRVQAAGAVLDGLEVQGEIYVTVPNVTVRNCKITLAGASSIGISIRPGADNALVDRCTISGVDGGANRLMAGVKAWGVGGVRISRCDIKWTSTGIQTDVGVVEHNYVHDMGYREGDHTNGFTSNAYGGGVTVRHNTIFNQLSQTDAISLFQDFGVQKNALIDDNLVAGGGYAIYGGGGSQPSSNIKITNNRFSRMYFPNGGYYGPLAHFDSNGAGNVFSGNVWDVTGAPLQ